MSRQIIRTALDEELSTLLPEPVDLWPIVASKWTIRQGAGDTSKNLSTRVHPHPQFRKLAWAILTLIFLVGVIFSVPQWRAVAAQKLSDFWQVLGLSGNATGQITFSETPPFTLFQPTQLPAGFTLKIVQGYSGSAPLGENGHTLTSEIVRQDGVDMPSSSIINEGVEAYQSDLPHALFVYQSGDGGYLLLYERAAQAGETLPSGLARIVNDRPAILQQEDDILLLTWIQNGAWLTLEATVDETSLLEVANNLEQTQTDDLASGGDEMIETAESALPLDLPFCNPADKPPNGPLLGALSGRQRLGDIWISFVKDERQPEGIAYSLHQPGIQEELFRQALAALQDPGLILEPLPYPTLGQYSSSTEEPCLQPDPNVKGYIVIEAWDNQVNVGYGGAGDRYVNRAIEVVERELELMP
jgi:hypothetical protein